MVSRCLSVSHVFDVSGDGIGAGNSDSEFGSAVGEDVRDKGGSVEDCVIARDPGLGIMQMVRLQSITEMDVARVEERKVEAILTLPCVVEES